MKPTPAGTILHFMAESENSDHLFPLDIPTFDRFNACYRTKSCWMDVTVGSDVADLPMETQFLLLKTGNDYRVYVPLLDGPFRAMLQPMDSGIGVRVISGDTQTVAREFDAVYTHTGSDPYELIHTAAAEIANHLGTVRLATDKPVPRFADLLGWCSYNACYQHVTQDKIKAVLERWQEHGQTMGFMLIDDGWQQVVRGARNHLTGFGADPEKFPDGMAAAAEMIKSYGVEELFAWLSFAGFWQGVDPESFAQYKPTMYEGTPLPYMSFGDAEESDGDATVGPHFLPQAMRHVSLPESWETFYNDYCESMADAGVDGIKIDAMTWIEVLGEGRGGRVKAMGDMLGAVEKATKKHMNGGLLNCSSCSNDHILQAWDAQVARTSRDFFPDKPESHGGHLAANAFASLWMGEFLLPDWDMFQTGHASGAFHAAARAISGGPVYTTDEIGKDDFSIVKRLALPDGRLPRCQTHARPMPDNLFADCLQDDTLLKVFNHNACSWVVGAFNCRYVDQSCVNDELRLTDIPGLAPAEGYGVYSCNDDRVQRLSREEVIDLALDELAFDILTVVPIQNGWAPIGLVDLYNPGGTVQETVADSVTLMGGGSFMAWCETRPTAVRVDGTGVPFEYEAHSLRVTITQQQTRNLKLIVEGVSE